MSQSNLFVTRQQILQGRKSGNIQAFFTLIPRGRPPNVLNKKKAPAAMASLAATKKVVLLNDKQQKKKKVLASTKNNYRDKETWEGLKHAVMDYLDDSNQYHAAIPLNTVKDNAMRFTAIANKHQLPIENVTFNLFWQGRGKVQQALLDQDQVKFLEDTITHRDLLNNGMSRGEVFKLMMEMSQTSSVKCVENHFDYLIRENRLTGLKRGGKVSTAQATTTKRSQITPEQQWRWHCTIDSLFNDLKRLNTVDGSGCDYEDLKEHFFGNLDETAFVGNSDGSVKVIASKLKKKTEANRDDCRASITSIRIGNAAGDQGPFIFLAKGKSNTHSSLSDESWAKSKNMPVGSCVAMTPNAYMTDDTWHSLAEKMCYGIRSMPVIKDHPDWWCGLTLDGFGLHVNVHVCQEIFAKHKIMICKEEGDTSQTNQAYDQFTARADKKLMNENMLAVRKTLGAEMTQWHLIKIAADAQSKIKKTTWINSFIKVNLHPKYRLSFDDWIKKLQLNGVLSSGTQFWKDGTSYYDAMPAFWRRMGVEQREEMVYDIDTMYRLTEEGKQVWSHANVKQLIKFCSLDDIPKARACYLAAKRDDRIITTTEADHRETLKRTLQQGLPAAGDPHHGDGQHTIDSFFSFKPPELIAAFRNNESNNNEDKKKLYDHMCNHAAQSRWNEDKAVEPSPYLDIEYTKDQSRLFNPSYKNVLQGFIAYDVKGKGAMKRLAKRRLDVIEGNINSYSRCLNDPKRMKAMMDHNQLVASVAEISADNEKDRMEKRTDLAAKNKAKEDKKQRAVNAFEKTKATKTPELAKLMEEKVLFFASEKHDTFQEYKQALQSYFASNLTKKQMMDLIKYYHCGKVVGMVKMSKEDLVEELLKLDDATTRSMEQEVVVVVQGAAN